MIDHAEQRWPGGSTGTTVTVGTFDGVHRGHWQLLQILRDTADRLGQPALLVTFDPHPLAIVRPDHAPLLLTTAAEKIEVLAESGLDYVAFLRFDRRLADYSPRRFVQEILIDRLHMRHLVIGYDHGFGKDRSGDAAMLRSIGAEIGFGVDVVPPVTGHDRPISSTSIRMALEAGDVAAAATALGRPYALRGTVVRGDGRGRQLGFPTANIRPPDPRKLVPLAGIYAARAQLPGHMADGVLHVGPRPTFPGAEGTIELHVFDFDGDLYGREISVSFCARLRDIARFDTVPSLVTAMAADARAARAALDAGACGQGGPEVTMNG